MNVRRCIAVGTAVLCGMVLAACGSSGSASSSASADTASLRDAVQTYTNDFLTGNVGAWSLVSKRCQESIGHDEYVSEIGTAGQLYGNAMPLTDFSAQISGGMARVTYGVAIKAVHKVDQPWTLEDGTWKFDAC